MKLKFADMKPGTIYIDSSDNLCVKLKRQTNTEAFSAVLVYDPLDETSDKPLSYLFRELEEADFVVANAFDIKRFFPED